MAAIIHSSWPHLTIEMKLTFTKRYAEFRFTLPIMAHSSTKVLNWQQVPFTKGTVTI